VAVGSGPEAPFDNGLGRHAGGWTAKEHAEFERDTRVFEQIDTELWK